MSEAPFEAEFIVVVNDEEQYALWPSERPLPVGWRGVGFRGSEADCMAWVDQVWTDLRPASLRRERP
ncbi:MAG TPA: MbtH family NRPS accessory protein [Actinopolymorphaceae bacterium]